MKVDLPDLPAGWVYLNMPARLWATVPAEERVTEQMIRDRAARMMHGDYTLERDLKRLVPDPHCEIAYSSPEYDGLWFPCTNLVHDENRRCKRHGGPGAVVVKKSYADLRRENDELRERLAALASKDGDE